MSKFDSSTSWLDSVAISQFTQLLLRSISYNFSKRLYLWLYSVICKICILFIILNFGGQLYSNTTKVPEIFQGAEYACIPLFTYNTPTSASILLWYPRFYIIACSDTGLFMLPFFLNIKSQLQAAKRSQVGHSFSYFYVNKNVRYTLTCNASHCRIFHSLAKRL